MIILNKISLYKSLEPPLHRSKVLTELFLKNNEYTKANLVPRPQKIEVRYNGRFARDLKFSMNRYISTPSDICHHISEYISNNSPLAMFNKEPHSMHSELEGDGDLDFYFFKDIDKSPVPLNNAYWFSSALFLGYVLESVFKTDLEPRIEDIPLGRPEDLHFYVTLSLNKEIIKDKSIISNLNKVLNAKVGEKLPFRSIKHVRNLNGIEVGLDQVITTVGDKFYWIHNKAPVISNSKFIGNFNVTGYEMTGKDVDRFFYKFRALTIPRDFESHFTVVNKIVAASRASA